MDLGLQVLPTLSAALAPLGGPLGSPPPPPPLLAISPQVSCLYDACNDWCHDRVLCFLDHASQKLNLLQYWFDTLWLRLHCCNSCLCPQTSTNRHHFAYDKCLPIIVILLPVLFVITICFILWPCICGQKVLEM